MTSFLIALVVGVVIPAVVAVLTKDNLPIAAKEAILLLLSTASGVLTGLLTHPPTGWAQWQHVIASIIASFVAAEASAAAQHKTGAGEAIHRATDNRVGIGPAPTKH